MDVDGFLGRIFDDWCLMGQFQTDSTLSIWLTTGIWDSTCFGTVIDSLPNISNPTSLIPIQLGLQGLRGPINVVSTTHILHQWGWDNQVKALKQLVRLSSSNAMVVGFQIGTIGLKEQPTTELAMSPPYWHDPASFHTIWEQVSRQTGTVWARSAVLKTWDEISWNPSDLDYLGHDARVIQRVAERGN